MEKKRERESERGESEGGEESEEGREGDAWTKSGSDATEPLNERALPLQRMRMGNRPIEDIRNAYAQGWRFSLSSRVFPSLSLSSSSPRFPFAPSNPLTRSLSFPLLHPPFRSLFPSFLPSFLPSTVKHLSLSLSLSLSSSLSLFFSSPFQPVKQRSTMIFIPRYFFQLLFPTECFRLKLLIVRKNAKFLPYSPTSHWRWVFRRVNGARRSPCALFYSVRKIFPVRKTSEVAHGIFEDVARLCFSSFESFCN